MGEFRLSVVIVTYNRCTDLAECLNSLFGLNDPPSEIIVVDSNSTDGTHKLAKNYPLKLVSIKEKSMVKARNVGFQHAEGDIVAYIDDDVVVSKDWSRHILEPYTDKSAGGVVGRVVPYNNAEKVYLPIKNNAIGKVFNNGFILGNFDTPTPQPTEVDTVIGCNMSFRRELLQKTGGFDENFRGSCFRDDTDMSIRVRNLGYKIIYQPKAIAQHKFKGKTVSNKWFYWTLYNHTYFYLKNFPPMNLQRIIRYLFATFLPPPDYVKKTGIRIKPTPLAVAYAAAGLINGTWMHRKGNPTGIEKILRIE